MFIGHFALGFAAKRVAPAVPLPALFAAAQFADLAWPVLVATGLEQVRIAPGDTAFTPLEFVSYPYSHSLAGLVIAGVLLGLLVQRRYRSPAAAPIVAALVVSHWVLDWITHRADMPLYPGSPRFGLGLWNHVPATLAIELALFAAGAAVYLGATRPRDAIGFWATAGLVIVILAAYAGNVLGPPPPSVSALITAAIAGAVVLVSLSAWADRHRSST